MRLFEFDEDSIRIPWDGNPNIGWWLDNDIITFYHGTHVKNIMSIIENGIFANTEGPTKGWISLALEPNTAFGYASMYGGETAFRAAGAKAHHVPPEERSVIVLKLPKKYVLNNMAPARGAMENERDKLTNKERYEEWKEKGKSDQEYYAITEIRMPDKIDEKYIFGYMRKY